MNTSSFRGVPAGNLHCSSADQREAVAENKAQEYLAGWQRALADYANLRKELDRRLSETAEATQDAVLNGLLPVVDYFDAAMQHMPESLKSDPWTEGVTRIHQALGTFLRHVGVEPFGAVGDPLDPARHEAVAEEAVDLPTGVISAIVARGYARNGRTLRPAKVRVSKGPGRSES